MGTPLPIIKFHHFELFTGNAKQAAYFYRKAFGFSQLGYMGPETGCSDKVSYVLGQRNIRLVLTTPLRHEDSKNVFLTLHGDAVKDVAFEVEDVDAVFSGAIERGASPVQTPVEISDGEGAVRQASVAAYGDVIHTFIARKDYNGPFLPGYQTVEIHEEPAGLLFIDHVVGNVEDRQMDRWANWYIDTFGFHQFVSYDDKDISTEFTALRSKVVASSDRAIKLPINEPAAGRKKSQIQEYIDFNVTAGVQHVALRTNNIIDTVSRLRDNGLEFLYVPNAYYESIWDRVGEIEEDRDKIADLNILVDRDEKGYLLQIFTKPVQDRPTLFFEVIQRRGCESFGKGNFKALFESIEREQAIRGNL